MVVCVSRAYEHILEFRSQPCTFLGYSDKYKGYKCISSSGRLFISRNVKFNETSFPFAQTYIDDSAISPPFSLSIPLYAPCITSTPLTASSTIHESVPNFSSPSSISKSSSHIPRNNLSVSRPEDTSSPLRMNQHHMITRSKVGTFKPRVLNAQFTDPQELHTVLEAQHHKVWVQAMDSEYDALMTNQTWSLVPLPPTTPVIGCQWIYKLKMNPDGSVARHKARLVAKGYSQTQRLDYNETFSSVVKPATIQIVLRIAVSRGWFVKQLDVNNAFLNGSLTEIVYMHQPPGYEIQIVDTPLVCKLHKAIYGLKQAPRAWFDKLRNALHVVGFTNSKADSSIFIMFDTTFIIYILVYVDDIIITGSHQDRVEQIIWQLNKQFF